MGGVLEEVLRRPFLDNAALVHHDDAIGDLAREAHLVRHADHGHAAEGQLLHHLEHLADHLRIERAGGFVEEHEHGPHRQCSCDRHALLLATGEAVGIGVAFVGQPNPCQQLLSLGDGTLARHFAHHDRRLDDILERRLVRPQVKALEDEADLGPLARDVPLRVLDELAVAAGPIADEVPVDFDAATVDLLQMIDTAQEGRLAGARRADDADDLLLAHVQGDAIQHLVPAKVLLDIHRADDQVRQARCVQAPLSSARRAAGAHLARSPMAERTPTRRVNHPSRTSRSLAPSLRSIRA